MEITRQEHLTFGTLCQSNYPTPSESNDPARITWLIKKDKILEIGQCAVGIVLHFHSEAELV